MRAVVIHAAQDLRIEEHSGVPAPGAGEVCINMAVGGICGSDLHYYSHGGFGPARFGQPMVLGVTARQIPGRFSNLTMYGLDATNRDFTPEWA